MTIRFLADAEAEFDDAVAYYESQLAGLGTEFADEIRAGLTRIEEFPEAWQLLGRRVRRVVGGDILVVAVMHLHRKPDYWQTRATET